MKALVLKFKNELEQKQDNIIFGKINGENLLIKEKGIYYDFLRIADGVRCGVIDLWSYKDILRNQYMIINKAKWLCIGQVNYIPLVLEKESNDVYIYDEVNEENKQWSFVGNFSDFIVDYLLGNKYAMFVSDYEDDLWYQFIHHNCSNEKHKEK